MPPSSPDAENCAIELAPMLDLTAAEPLQRTLLGHPWTGDQLVLSASAVERVSTAAVQVLLAAAAEARRRGVGFSLRAPSMALRDALADLGLSHHLDVRD